MGGGFKLGMPLQTSQGNFLSECFFLSVAARLPRSQSKMLADTFQLQWYRLLITSCVGISVFPYHIEVETIRPSFCRPHFQIHFVIYMRLTVFWLKCHWNVFPLVQITIRLYTPLSYYLNQWWPRLIAHIFDTRFGWVQSIIESFFSYMYM